MEVTKPVSDVDPPAFAPTHRKRSWRSWGSLVRVPNTLTAVADIFAGASVAQGSIEPLASFTMLAFASVAFYWAGMVLNDVFDVEEDRAHHRRRPIVVGEISLVAAKRLAWILIGLGMVFAAVSPFQAWRDFHWIRLGPWLVACLLTLSILAYDRWLKNTPLAPWIMGLCRGLNILLGGSLLLGQSSEGFVWTSMQPLLVLVLGQVLFVAGFTWAARREETTSDRQTLIFGWSVCLLGIACLALVPRFVSQASTAEGLLHLDPIRWYPFLIVMLAFPLIRRAILAIVSLQPGAVQGSIKQAIMTIILFDAAATLEFAGPIPGSLCCLMILPSLWLGTWFRST